MKTNWKHMSAALLFLAGTAQAGAVTTDSDKKPVEERATSTPAVQARGKKVFVNLLNLKGESVTVKVYDEESRLLYLKNFEEAPVIEKAFNFEEAYEGSYSVVVNDGEATYTASVEVAR
jgi:hypothetical protein